MAENVARDNHIGLISVDGDAVHAQELRQQGGTVTFHNILGGKHTHTQLMKTHDPNNQHALNTQDYSNPEHLFVHKVTL